MCIHVGVNVSKVQKTRNGLMVVERDALGGLKGGSGEGHRTHLILKKERMLRRNKVCLESVTL